MLLVDIDGNGVLELEELKHFHGAQEILEPYFQKLNKNMLTKRNISELFPTKEKFNDILKLLENVFIYGERDEFSLGRSIEVAVTNVDECSAREIRRFLNDLREGSPNNSRNKFYSLS